MKSGIVLQFSISYQKVHIITFGKYIFKDSIHFNL